MESVNVNVVRKDKSIKDSFEYVMESSRSNLNGEVQIDFLEEVIEKLEMIVNNHHFLCKLKLLVNELEGCKSNMSEDEILEELKEVISQRLVYINL